MITLDQITEALEADDCKGFCLSCGAEAWECEPDARAYECEECGEFKVYGAAECLLLRAR